MVDTVLQGMHVSAAFLAKGGVLMIPIGCCSLIAVALMIERFWYYHQARCSPEILTNQVYPQVKARKFDVALAMCQNMRGVLPKLFTLVLQQQHRPTIEIEQAISIAGTRELQKLGQYVRSLGIIGQVTPLLGLLGTVLGMVKTFMKIADLQGHVNPSLLAGGIWEALITTAAGLTVAIPVMIVAHYFEGVVEQFAFQLKNYSLELLELVKHD